MIRMPAIAESGSSIRSRVRFQEPPTDPSDVAVDAGGNEANGDREVVTAKGFELKEDPSFWKDHNVQVIIRIRPLNNSELSFQGHNKCVRQDNCQTVTWTVHPESRFTFDLVADEHVSQEKLFKVAGVPMVENCVAGYNSCMFAYGQTGSGKTHTMLGDLEEGTRRNNVNCGMTPRVFEYLFTRIQKEKEARRDEKIRFTCKCSFLEIYNEQILDLLEPSSVNLQLREDAKKGIHVENLTEFEVSSARDIMQQLIQGATNRKVAATNMNRASSRSHSVFTCVIESKWESQGVTHHRFARLNLVDLAGSERQKSSGAEGDRLKEATNINKSLSTLGLVIMNLVGISNKKSLHVPYRDSKLTFLLQDSLGGNSKTIIIANISPSNCCALETLSTLKFAQRAKFIRNNAIVNEDASGDVLAMRLQIQHLKKEVDRLRGLVNGGSENSESDGLSAFIPGSPAFFKWEGGHGSFSPLTFDKRLSQRKEYEAALVAAFRRNQEKDAALKALAAGKQAAENLATQRTDEVRSLKMRLRFREEGIKRLEAVACEKLSAESHLLQEREEIMKEIEVLRNKVDRNTEVTRFAMENLQLKEDLRRLQSFVEEGERETMNEQITVLQDKLLEALDWKLMHEKDSEVVQDLSFSLESSVNAENEFLRLQAIQTEREVEALRKNLSFSLEAKEKLERRVDDLISQLEEQRKSTAAPNEETQHSQINGPTAPGTNDSSDNQMNLKAMVDAISAASQREAEAHEMAIILAKENEELHLKLRVLFEDNNKLLELNEVPANRAQSTLQMDNTEDLDNSLADFDGDGLLNSSSVNYYSETKDVEHLEHQLHEMHEENDKLMGLYEEAMKERDEYKRMLSSYEHHNAEAQEEVSCSEKLVEVDEEGVHPKQKDGENLEERAKFAEVPVEKLCLVITKLDLMQDRLVTAGKVFKIFGLIEKSITEVDEISGKIAAIDHDALVNQQDITALQLALCNTLERKTAVGNKFLALKVALQNFSNAHYWVEKEVRSRAKADEYSRSLEQKKEELMLLQNRKNEIDAVCAKAQRSESELRNNIDSLKFKFQDAEDRRKQSERALFAIDNLDKADFSSERTLDFGKASELLKSEEERTKISAEMKQLRVHLTAVQKEIKSSLKMSEALDGKIQSLNAEIESRSSSLKEAEFGLQKIVEEMDVLAVMRENGRTELGKMIVEYQQCVFESDLKGEEIKFCEDALRLDTKKLEDLTAKRILATENLNRLMEVNRCKLTLSDFDASSCNVSEKLEEELGDVQRSLAEAQALLLGSNDR